MNKKSLKRGLSIILCIALMVSLLSGCNFRGKNDSPSSSKPTIDTSKIIEETTRKILEEIVETEGQKEQEDTKQDADAHEAALLPPELEDYEDDLETVVYGLLANELKYAYDVFPAYVELNDGMSVSGIAYTDYSKCYTNEEETKAIFEAGIIPFQGEIDIPKEQFDEGLYLHNYEYQDETTSFILAYESEPFAEHCVIYDKYLRYGVDDNGHVFYDVQDFSREICDESLGSLYSYDEDRYLLTDFGDYEPISGTSLFNEIDYEELERQVNEILENQDSNFANVDIQTTAYYAKEAVQSFLLSMQEETFLGYSVDELVKLAEDLDPLECYRFTKDGVSLVHMDESIGNEPTKLVKWLVGTSCAIAVAVAMVGSMVTIECPPLSAASSAVAGIGIEVFMQVVISNKSLQDVDWRRVALAAAAGAISGFYGPYIQANFSGASYFFIDSFLDGLVGATEKSVAAWLDGEDGEKIIKDWGYGLALGFALSAGFKVAGKMVEVGIEHVSPKIEKICKKIAPKLTKKTSKLIKIITSNVNESLVHLKEVADSTPFHSKYIANLIAWKQIEKLVADNSEELISDSFKQLTNKYEVLDVNDNVISKDDLRKLFNDAVDDEVIAKIKIDDDVVEIIKKNSMVSILFDKSKYVTVEMPDRLVADRNVNFEEAAKQFKQKWLDDPSLMPDSIKTQLEIDNLELEDLMPKDIVKIIKNSDWVMHENIDMITITLVPRVLHEGLSHMGGYGLAKFLKYHMGSEFFKRLLDTASAAITFGGQ